MAQYFVRNLRSPTFPAYSLCPNAMALYYRELLRLGGWSEISNDADAAWTSCVLVDEAGGAGSGFSVSAANPTRIYSSAGVFTAAMQTNECAIFLRAGINAQNRVAGRIKLYISANYVEIDPDSAPPNGWINEGVPGAYIPGRIVSPKAATLGAGAWVLLQAPSGNNRALITHVNTGVCRVQTQPKGGAADSTTIPAAGIDLGTAYDQKVYFNAVLEDPNAVIYAFGNYTPTYNYLAFWGELEQTVAADTDPGFIQGSLQFATFDAWNYPTYMLSGNPVSTEMVVYPTVMKWYLSQNQASGPITSDKWRLQNGNPGKAALYRPLIVLDNVINFGGCLRGRMPLIRYVNTNFEKWRVMDPPYNWLHLAKGFVVPGNGPNDPRIAIPYA